jgi:general stress protein YciG
MSTKSKRGFASMTIEERRKIASQGGKSHSKEHFSEIGKLGGIKLSADRDHMAKIGSLGGKAVSKNRKHMAEIGHKGGIVKKKKPEDGAV